MTRQSKITLAILAIGSATILVFLTWPRSADREATPVMAPSGSEAGEKAALALTDQDGSHSRAGERSAVSAESSAPRLAQTLIRVMSGDPGCVQAPARGDRVISQAESHECREPPGGLSDHSGSPIPQTGG